MKSKKLKLITIMLTCLASGVTLADMTPPPQAKPPTEPQKRPEPQQPATGIVVEMHEATVVEGQKPAANESISDKTRNEIYAMLADQVKKVENVVILEHEPVADNTQLAMEGSPLSVADQPNGHFRVYAEIGPRLEKGKATVKLQLLKAGHSGDAQDMAKPITEKTIKVDPENVRKSEKDIVKFLKSELHMEGKTAQEAMKRPNMSMWIEVKNQDGSEGVKNGSNLVIYYKPDNDLYVNLYYVNAKNEIQRLVPSKFQNDNFVKKGQIYRFPATGEGLSVSGKGIDKIRAIYTRIPSGAGRDIGLTNGLQAKQMPIGVIPTQYPALFSTADLGKFFSLPEQIFNENEISYEIK